MATKLIPSQVAGEPGGLYTEVFGALEFSSTYGSLIGATATATVTATESGGAVTSVTIGAGGTYGTIPPALVVVGGGGSGAVLQAVVSSNTVSAVNIIKPGSGYTTNPSVLVLNELLLIDFVNSNHAGWPTFLEAKTTASRSAPRQWHFNLAGSLVGGAAVFSMDLIPIPAEVAPSVPLATLGGVGFSLANAAVRLYKNGTEFTPGTTLDSGLTGTLQNALRLKYKKNL
jgi:hypothetical protein